MDVPLPSEAEPESIDLTAIEIQMNQEGKDFSMQFFATIYDEHKSDENIVFSPLSLNMALAMVWNGTNGETKQAIQKATGMSDYPAEAVNTYFKKLNEALTNADPKVRLALANSIWYDLKLNVKPAFINTNQEYYDAEVRSLDFKSPEAPGFINQWCSDHTNGLIKEMIMFIPSNTCMYLLNALYFKGEWSDHFGFPKLETKDVSFQKADGSWIPVKMMSQSNQLDYYKDEHLAFVSLPYGNGAFSMYFLLPQRSDSFNEMLSQLKQPDYWNQCLAAKQSTEIDIFIPRFKIAYEFQPNLNESLQRAGMGIAFTGAADFSGIADDPLAISEVKQKIYIDVNEEGTEAAAVTSVAIERTSINPNQKPTFRADRPFLFVIRENSTGTILFMGKIGEPKVE
jgi:serpin B